MKNTGTATLALETTLFGKCRNCGEHAFRTVQGGTVSHSDSGETDCGELLEINLSFALPAEAYAQGWGHVLDELQASIAATLHELIGDDGNAYSPAQVTISEIAPLPVAAAE